MGRVLTNNVSLAYTIETALGVAGTTWFLVEPNSINTFGADITTIARSPISKNRQRRKGTVTDLDSPVEYEEDLTMSSFRHFMEGFLFSVAVNADVTELATPSCETTTDSFEVAAMAAAAATKMDVGTLIFTKNFLTAANNGLFVVDADISTSATAITVAENLVDETAPSNAKLSIAGYQAATGDSPTWTYSAPQATLNFTGIGTAMAQAGLTVGQRVHIGAPDGAGGVDRAFENGGANDMFGYARVISIAADDIVFDKIDAALRFTDAVAPSTAVAFLFGEFVRNVATDDAAYLEQSFQFEAEFVGLDAGGASEFQYALGNYCNTAGFELALTDKAMVTYGFVGTDTEDPVVAGSRKTGASAATDPTMTGAFNTSADIATLRITEVDETGLTTDFKSLTMTFNNNATPEKVLGQLGAKFINVGNFEVDIETQLVFTEGLVIDKIRANETLAIDFIITNDDGAIAIDVPSMTLDGGDREFPVNESVLINTTAMAHQDDVLGYSLSASTFPIVP